MSRPGEIGQWLYTAQAWGLKLKSSRPHNKPGMVSCVPVIPALYWDMTGESPWLVGHHLCCRFSERSCLQRIKQRVLEHHTDVLLWPPCTHIYTYTQIYRFRKQLKRSLLNIIVHNSYKCQQCATLDQVYFVYSFR